MNQNKSVSLQEAVLMFLRHKKADEISLQTLAAYQEHLADFTVHADGQRDVRAITPDDVIYWRDTLKARGLAPSTIALRLTILRTFWHWCVAAHLVDHTPMLIRIKTTAPDPDTVRAITAAALDALLEAAHAGRSRFPERDYAILRFLADTGCRVGALRRLTLSKLDLERGEAHLIEKASKPHKVFLSSKTVEALEAWLRVRPRIAGVEEVFITHHGGPFKRAAVRALLLRLADYAGVDGPVNPHAFRHYRGQTLCEAGMPNVAQRQLGHANIQTTLQWYVRAHDDWMKGVIDDLAP